MTKTQQALQALKQQGASNPLTTIGYTISYRCNCSQLAEIEQDELDDTIEN